MIGKLCDWFDHRTGYRKFMSAMLLEHIPGGAKWRYVWGSCLAFVFMIQLVTGILLMTAYSPGDSTAWGSVYYIQYEMDFGWLIRGLHHFGSQTMVVLIGLHMLQVVIAGAHLPPREVNWWLGLLLMAIVLGLSLTGYLLPWDQKGFFATQVATNIAGQIPGIGEFQQKILVGGSEYGHATLTRFFALHVGVLPPLMVIVLVVHIVVFRRHGVTTPSNAQGEGWFWPDQAFRDLVMCLVVFGIMLALVVFGGQGTKVENHPPEAGQSAHKDPGLYEKWAKAGREGWGASLDAPADRETQGYPARPEWYFLFLFQLLKYFEGDQFLIGAFFIPNGVMLALILLPLFGYGRMRKFGHLLGVAMVVALAAFVTLLTMLALAADSPEPWPLNLGGGTAVAKGFHHRQEEAAKEARRAVQLAAEGIPEEGARELLRRDPLTKGPQLFRANCAACHRFEGLTETGKFKAADLSDFASAKWIRGLLENPGSEKYFGNTNLTGMKGWRTKYIDRPREKWRQKDSEAAKKRIAEQDAELDAISHWLAQQALPAGKRDQELEIKGKELFLEHCNTCHSFGGERPKQGPDLTGYGSQEWLRLMLVSPTHPSRYPKNNAMPAFRPSDGPGAAIHGLEFTELERLRRRVLELEDPDEAKTNESKTPVQPLSDIDRELLIRWMARDYRVVFGGQAIIDAKLR